MIQKIVARINQIQSQILLSIVYFVILPIFVLIGKRKSLEKATWTKWKIKSDSLDDLRKQF